MLSPLLIAQIEPPQAPGGGDYFYRTDTPGLAMTEGEGIYVVNLTSEHRLREEIAAEADVLILKNICDPDFLPTIQKRKQQGKTTFYEIADDLLAVPEWNPVYFFYKDPENQRLFQRLAHTCDGLQFTCKRLQALYGHLNPKTRVFPNQMLGLPPERSYKEKERLIIGWGGSHGHLEDLAEIADPLIQWLCSRPHVSLHLMCSDPIWKLFESVPESQKQRTRPGTIDDYYGFLSKVDIGLIPMKETGFNRSRSDIKFVEYAAAGAAAVIRKMDPYEESARHGENAMVFENGSQMADCLERLCRDWPFLMRLAKTARDYVARNRLQRDHVQERLDYYARSYPPDNQPSRKEDCFSRWSHTKGAVVNGRRLQLRPTRFEQLLHDGLVMMQVQKDSAAARRLFEEATQMEPRNYLPHLFGAQISPDPIASLHKALELRADSLKAGIMLGEQHARALRIREAMEAFEAVARLFPEYEVPYLRAADLLERINQKAEARKLYERVNELIKPFTRPAP